MHPIIPLASDEPIDPRVNAEPLRTPSFSLGTLFLAVAWLCVLLALAKVATEFALILAGLTLPAFARTCWLNEQYVRHGQRVSATLNGLLFLSSIAAVTAIIAAFGATLFAACSGMLILAVSLAEILPHEAVAALWILAVIPGFIIALALAMWVGIRVDKLLRPRIALREPEARAQIRNAPNPQ
jgi:predicted permease